MGGAEIVQMTYIDGGRFVMGLNKQDDPQLGPERTVNVQAFEISRSEVTVDLYMQYAADTGAPLPGAEGCFAWTSTQSMAMKREQDFEILARLFDTPDHPVSCVSRKDADAFIDWLNGVTGGGTSQPAYRLPTEREVEYLLSRNDDTVAAYLSYATLSGDGAQSCLDWNSADFQSAFDWRLNACDDGTAEVAPVASYRPDVEGVFDLRGNLWEWVADCWEDSHRAVNTYENCGRGTLKGGSFDDPVKNLFSYVRQSMRATQRQANVGFRLARDAR